MMDERLYAHLGHLRHEAREAIKFMIGMDKTAFIGNSLVQHAVGMCLVNIGEATTRIMDRHAGFAAAHPEIPWHNIRKLRNRVAHGYHDLDFDIVWEVIQIDLPALLEKLPVVPEP